MKKIIAFLFLIIMAIGCDAPKETVSNETTGTFYTDTFYKPAPMQQELNTRVFVCDSTLNARDIQIVALRDSMAKLKATKDSLGDQLFIAKYKLERVKYYVSICMKNPTNDKFLKGWVRRATE